MNSEPIKEVLNELFSHLERLETQSDAILQFLKEKKRVTDKQLAPYLEQAGNASNVRWRAARVRTEHLLSLVETKEEETKVGKKPEIAQAETNKEQATPVDKKAAEASQQASSKEQTIQRENKSKDEQPDSAKEESAHPTEMTAELAQKEGAEPPAELPKEKKSGDQEAA